MSEARTTGLSRDEASTLAYQEIKPYVTALALQERIDGQLRFIGSGTFVKWGNNYGILTAEHVVNNPDVASLSINTDWSSEQILLVILDNHANQFGFDCKVLRVLTTGQRLSAEQGPDLAVIVLPPGDHLHTLLSKRSFWPLDVNSENNLAAAMASTPWMAIVGHPDEEVRSVDPQPGFREQTFSGGIVGHTEQRHYYRNEPYDYLEVLSQYAEGSVAPLSLQGVSGGSLWRVHFGPENGSPDTFSFHGVTLAGVPFYQIPYNETPGHWIARCHGPRSIYLELPNHLI